MKVLIINVVCGIKSTGRICTDIATELEKQGHEVKIIYGRDNVPMEYERFAKKVGTDLDVKVHVALSRISDSAGFHSTIYTRRLIEWIKEYNPDVINLHNIHGYYINVEVLFKYLRTCGKRVIWTLHDCWPFTGHSALCDGDDCEKWIEGCSNCPQKGEYPKSLVDKSTRNWNKKKANFCDIPNLIITTPSRWMKDNVEKSFLSRYPCEVINNGVDIDIFKPSAGKIFRDKYGLDDKYIVLGVSTAWGHKKGYEDFLQLASMLDNGYKVVLVGVEDKLKIDSVPNLLTLGRTSSIQELAEIYSAANVFVNLTYCDTYPTVNLEARACGLPIITYNTGGSPEAAGKDALVVEKADLCSIAKRVVELKTMRIFDKEKTCYLDESKKQFLSNRYYINKYIELIMEK